MPPSPHHLPPPHAPLILASCVKDVNKANNGATLGSRKLPHRVPPLLAGWPSMMAARTNRTWSHLELWSGSRADPRSLRGAEMARYRAPATDRVRNCRSCKRGMQWEAMGRVQDAGWVAGVTCKIATMALKILVEAPGFRCSSSCSQKCRIGWHCSHPGRLMDDADQLGASHGSCKRAIESSATTIIN